MEEEATHNHALVLHDAPVYSALPSRKRKLYRQFNDLAARLLSTTGGDVTVKRLVGRLLETLLSHRSRLPWSTSAYT